MASRDASNQVLGGPFQFHLYFYHTYTEVRKTRESLPQNKFFNEAAWSPSNAIQEPQALNVQNTGSITSVKRKDSLL